MREEGGCEARCRNIRSARRVAIVLAVRPGRASPLKVRGGEGWESQVAWRGPGSGTPKALPMAMCVIAARHKFSMPPASFQSPDRAPAPRQVRAVSSHNPRTRGLAGAQRSRRASLTEPRRASRRPSSSVGATRGQGKCLGRIVPSPLTYERAAQP